MATATAAWLNEVEMQAWEAFLRASIRLMEGLDTKLEGHGISLADSLNAVVASSVCADPSPTKT